MCYSKYLTTGGHLPWHNVMSSPQLSLKGQCRKISYSQRQWPWDSGHIEPMSRCFSSTTVIESFISFHHCHIFLITSIQVICSLLLWFLSTSLNILLFSSPSVPCSTCLYGQPIWARIDWLLLFAIHGNLTKCHLIHNLSSFSLSCLTWTAHSFLELLPSLFQQ